jgi:hypothetical protein
MDEDQLAYSHLLLSCFDKNIPSSIERYETRRLGNLLRHLRERHRLDLERVLDYCR